MALNQKTPRREVGRGSQKRPFSVTMNVTIETDRFERIRELAEREGATAASMARQLIDEALHARERGESRSEAAPRPDCTSHRDGRRSPRGGSSAIRTQATARRRDII
jgi:hypothetical protein